jgi:CBS-domain-containing membrane protein
VKTVPDTESAAQVFKLLDDKHISGIGIVDGDGKLVSNLSRSDLRVCSARRPGAEGCRQLSGPSDGCVPLIA